MATEIAKVSKENDVSAPNTKKALDSTDAPAVVETPSYQVSEQEQVDGSAETEAKGGSPMAHNEPVTDVQKKMKRAERFGMPVKLSEEEKRTSRAERRPGDFVKPNKWCGDMMQRFGSAVNSNGTDAVKSSEDQKRKARAERFGIPVETASDEEAKKKARLAKFSAGSKVDNVEDDKRKARALRFAKPSNGSVSKVNDKEKPEPKISVEGNVGGAA